MEFHEIANVFPLLEGAEFNELVSDIKHKGLREAIILFEGRILDGRNRFRACQKAEIQPHFETYQGSDPVGFVVSLNLHRRHLSSSQCAACAVDAEAIMQRLEAEAAERKKELSGIRANPGEVVEKIPQREEPKTRDKAAALFNTNPRYVQDAKKLKEENPEAFEQVKAGKVTISKVNQQRKREERLQDIAESAKQAKELSGLEKYAVIYADPPCELRVTFEPFEEKNKEI